MTVPSQIIGESTATFRRDSNELRLEFIRAVLMHCHIQAAIVRHDPFGMLSGIFDLLILASDHARAKAALAEMTVTTDQPDWTCPLCLEIVPGHFEVCWNCDTIRNRGSDNDAASECTPAAQQSVASI
jgi:hypothetical protein